MRTLWTFVGLGLLSLTAAACSGATQADDEDGDFGALSGDQSELKGKTLTVPSGGSKAFTFTSQGSEVAIAIDCNVSANPDEVGPVFNVDAPDLNLASNESPKAGAFGWSGPLAAGTHTITLESVSGSARCSVKVGGAGSSSCKAYESWHSPNTNHTHFAVGTDTSEDWEAFPASGNHWGSWAPWNKVYTTPVKKAFLLHNLEHGGVVLSYKCDSNASSECAAAESKLKSLADGMGLQRFIITPDPTQRDTFAVRAWRWLYTSSCLNDTAAKAFITSHIRHGREDIDADPPIPFDPTTTNVPCQDLMAAPDSCY